MRIFPNFQNTTLPETKFLCLILYKKEGLGLVTLLFQLLVFRAIISGNKSKSYQQYLGFAKDAWNKFRKPSPKWCFFFIAMNPMVQSGKNHLQKIQDIISKSLVYPDPVTNEGLFRDALLKMVHNPCLMYEFWHLATFGAQWVALKRCFFRSTPEDWKTATSSRRTTQKGQTCPGDRENHWKNMR